MPSSSPLLEQIELKTLMLVGLGVLLLILVFAFLAWRHARATNLLTQDKQQAEIACTKVEEEADQQESEPTIAEVLDELGYAGSDLAFLREAVEKLLARPALPPSPTAGFNTLERGQTALPTPQGWVPSAPRQTGQLTAPQHVAPRALSAPRVVHHPHPSQVAAALGAGPSAPSAIEAPLSADDTRPNPGAGYVHAAYGTTGEEKSPEVPNPASTAWFNGPTAVVENGGPHAPEKKNVAMPASLVADEAWVPEGAGHEPTGVSDDDGPLGTEVGQGGLTEPLPVAEHRDALPESAAADPVAAGTPSGADDKLGSPKDVDPVAELEKTLNGIRRDSLAFPPSHAGMKPVTGDPSAADPAE